MKNKKVILAMIAAVTYSNLDVISAPQPIAPVCIEYCEVK